MANNEPNQVNEQVLTSPRRVWIQWNFPLDTDTPDSVSILRINTTIAQFTIDPLSQTEYIDFGPFPNVTTDYQYSVCADYPEGSKCAPGPGVPDPATNILVREVGYNRATLAWRNGSGANSVFVGRQSGASLESTYATDSDP